MKGSATAVRVGVIGIGYGQHVLVPAFRMDPRCEVVAVAASTAARAEHAAGKIAVPAAYGDWRALIQSNDVDVVAISVPPALQPEMAIEALGLGKPVFCEKPLASTLPVAERLAEAALASGVPNMVDFLFPEIPLWKKAKEILEHGGVGNIRHTDLFWSVETFANRMGLDSWKTRTHDGGGALNNFFSHSFYYLEWFLGPAARMSVRLIQTPSDVRLGETIVALTMEFVSGVTANASLNTAALLTHQHRLMFHGDDGTLILDNPTADNADGFRLHHGTRQSEVLQEILHHSSSNDPYNFGEDGRIVAAAVLVSRLLDWMESGVPGAPNMRHGLRVQQLLDVARVSNATGSWVDIPALNQEG